MAEAPDPFAATNAADELRATFERLRGALALAYGDLPQPIGVLLDEAIDGTGRVKAECVKLSRHCRDTLRERNGKRSQRAADASAAIETPEWQAAVATVERKGVRIENAREACAIAAARGYDAFTVQVLAVIFDANRGLFTSAGALHARLTQYAVGVPCWDGWGSVKVKVPQRHPIKPTRTQLAVDFCCWLDRNEIRGEERARRIEEFLTKYAKRPAANA